MGTEDVVGCRDSSRCCSEGTEMGTEVGSEVETAVSAVVNALR